MTHAYCHFNSCCNHATHLSFPLITLSLKVNDWHAEPVLFLRQKVAFSSTLGNSHGSRISHLLLPWFSRDNKELLFVIPRWRTCDIVKTSHSRLHSPFRFSKPAGTWHEESKGSGDIGFWNKFEFFWLAVWKQRNLERKSKWSRGLPARKCETTVTSGV